MIRKIIQIDTEKCNGCGLCAKACHEGAIGMVDGEYFGETVPRFRHNEYRRSGRGYRH